MFNELRSDLVLPLRAQAGLRQLRVRTADAAAPHRLARAGAGGPTTPASGPAPAPAEPAVSEPALALTPARTPSSMVGAPLTPTPGKRLDRPGELQVALLVSTTMGDV